MEIFKIKMGYTNPQDNLYQHCVMFHILLNVPYEKVSLF